MGKKISIDSSTMMNKIFEFIEAKKIFNLSNNQLSILIHPSSFVHAIVFFKGNLIKLLAHETTMSVPISNALGIKNDLNNTFVEKNYDKLNYLKFLKPNEKMFPLWAIWTWLSINVFAPITVFEIEPLSIVLLQPISTLSSIITIPI